MTPSLRLAVVAPLLLATGCSQFNPYLNPAENLLQSGNEATARELSLQLQSDLVREANHFANEKGAGALVLAGSLGLGAYKLATEGGAHQIAALAAGSGAVYGLSRAMYNQEIIVIIHETASTLACLDIVYGDNGLTRAKELVNEISKFESRYTAIQQAKKSYYAAKLVLSAVEDEYKSNVRIVASSYNRRRALHETDPETIYQFINGATSSSASELQTINPATPQLPTGAEGLVPEPTPAEKQTVAALNELITELNAWINWVKGLPAKDVSAEVKQCRSGFSPPQIPELGSSNKVTTSGIYRLTNTSGNIGVHARLQTGTDLEAVALTEKGEHYISISGTAATGKVYVTDYGKDEALLVIEVEIKN